MTGDRSRHAPQKQHGDAVYGDGGNRTHGVFPATDTPPAPRSPMPPLAEIQAYWEAQPDLVATFPDLRLQSIGWGEPFCFRCGWLAPVRDANTDGALPAAWNRSAGWLERAHLHDHASGGSEEPSNLVPLCIGCHHYQPCSDTHETGIAYVNEDVVCPGFFMLETDRYIGRTIKGPKDALYWRAMARYVETCWRAGLPPADDWPRPAGFWDGALRHAAPSIEVAA